MKYLLLSLFLTANAFAASGSGNVSSVIGLGGSQANGYAIYEPTGNPSGWFTLHAGGAMTAGQFRAFVKDGGPSQYVVPAGGITCYHIAFAATLSGADYQLASSTAADGFLVGALTLGQKYQGGVAGVYIHEQLTARVLYGESIVYAFAAGDYPYFQTDATTTHGVSLTCKAN